MVSDKNVYFPLAFSLSENGKMIMQNLNDTKNESRRAQLEVNNLRYPEDTLLIAENKKDLQ